MNRKLYFYHAHWICRVVPYIYLLLVISAGSPDWEGITDSAVHAASHIPVTMPCCSCLLLAAWEYISKNRVAVPNFAAAASTFRSNA